MWIIHAPVTDMVLAHVLSARLFSIALGSSTRLLTELMGGLTLRIHPLSVQVGQHGLIRLLFETLRRLLIHQTATSPPPPLVLVLAAGIHLAFGRLHTQWRRGVDSLGEGDASPRLEKCGRQFGSGVRRPVSMR